MHTLIIQPEAKEDIQESFDWYEAQKPGLGYEFLEKMDEALAEICANPLYYGSLNKNLRRYRIKRFPFLIVYGINKKKIAVVGVRHMSRKPKF